MCRKLRTTHNKRGDRRQAACRSCSKLGVDDGPFPLCRFPEAKYRLEFPCYKISGYGAQWEISLKEFRSFRTIYNWPMMKTNFVLDVSICSFSYFFFFNHHQLSFSELSKELFKSSSLSLSQATRVLEEEEPVRFN